MFSHHRPRSASFTHTLDQFTQHGNLQPLLRMASPPPSAPPAPRRPLRPRAWLSMALLLGGLGLGSAAFCATPCDGGGPLSPDAVRAELREQGYATVWVLHQQGEAFHAEAIDHTGNPVSLWVDAHSGELLTHQRLGLL